MTERTPRLCDLVVYRTLGTEYPALITRINADGSVELKGFPPGREVQNITRAQHRRVAGSAPYYVFQGEA